MDADVAITSDGLFPAGGAVVLGSVVLVSAELVSVARGPLQADNTSKTGKTYFMGLPAKGYAFIFNHLKAVRPQDRHRSQ